MKRTCVGIALTALVLTAGCGRRKEGPSGETFVVKRLGLRDVVSQTGEVTPVVKVDIKSEASGRIERVYVKEGQRVEEGDKLVTIDPERLLTRKKKLDLSVEEARIRRDIAKRNYERSRELSETGTVSRRQLEDLESEYRLKEIAYQQQLLERKDIVDQLKETTVVAPMSGVLTHLNVEEGEIAVSATSGYQSGTIIGTVADIERLEVITEIGEVDYPKLYVGQPVVIRPEAAEAVQTHGTIDFISLTARKEGNDELGSFEVRIAIDSVVTGVVPGVNVNVDFVVLEKGDVLAVPYHFVKRRGGRAMVTRVTRNENGERTVGPARVKTGSTDFRHYEILDGLAEGDTVMFRPEMAEGGPGRRRGGRG
ncbi:MAG: efflux RND transporter periplasmic adaptor subunit [Chitinivibrionales bacterium]|nr:efflux RND transporter periplasmic adaptor subunit [Chitinivibrionales bacterium]